MNKRERGKRLMKEELKDRHENIYMCVCEREFLQSKNTDYTCEATLWFWL